MIILSTVKNYLKILGAYTDNLTTDSLPPLVYVHNLFILICLIFYAISVLSFVLLKATTFAEYAEGALFCAIAMSRIKLYLLLIAKRSDLAMLIKDLEEMIEKRSQSPEIRDIYNEVNTESESFTRTFWRCLSSTIAFTAALKMSKSYYDYFVAGLSDDSFKLLLPTVFPWDWKTPVGYAAAVSLQFLWLYGGIFVVMTLLLIFSGLCMLFGAFTSDIKRHLSNLNDVLLKMQGNFTTTNRLQFKKTLFAIIEFQSNAKQMMNRLTELYQLHLTTFFALSITGLCSGLLSLNDAVDRRNTVDIVRMLFFFLYVVVYLAFLCFFGQHASSRYEEIHADICECSWNEFPFDMQQILPMMLVSTQNPAIIQGFMNVQCTREAFKKIMNASFSYFSVLRGV